MEIEESVSAPPNTNNEKEGEFVNHGKLFYIRD